MLGGEILIWLHLCAMAAYVGAQFAVIYMLIPAAETASNEEARRKSLIAGFKFYNPFTIGVLGIIVITGAMRLTDLKASMKFDYFARIGAALELKLGLASKFRGDCEAYTDAKTDFIESVLRKVLDL